MDREQEPDSVDPDRSVTCPICGALADERETVSLWEDDYAEKAKRRQVGMFPDGEAHQQCFERVISSPVEVPQEAIETVMEFLALDDHLRRHVRSSDDLAAAIVALNRARGEAWEDEPWSEEWSA